MGIKKPDNALPSSFLFRLTTGGYIFNEKNIQILKLLIAHINTTNVILIFQLANDKSHRAWN
jgi:hypothetical protein